MRYAAISAAVFGSAMFMAAGSHTSATGSHPLNNITAPAIMHVIGSNDDDQSTRQALPHNDAAIARPAKLVATTATPTAVADKPADNVAVAPGDSLDGLAESHATTASRLYAANPAVENPDMIYPGEQLRIPAPEEQLPERQMPTSVPVATISPTAASARQSIVAQTKVAAAAPAIADGSVWDRLAACESGGNWAINTGNGFYGGIQFTLGTWQSLGGSGLPSDASREEQISRAQMLQARSGWGQWPACSTKLGLL